MDRVISLVEQINDAECRMDVGSLTWLRSASHTEIQQLLSRLLAFQAAPDTPAARIALGELVQRARLGASDGSEASALEALYGRYDAASLARGPLLQWHAQQSSTESLRTFARLLTTDPPQQPEAVGLAISPLFRHKSLAEDALFPQLLDALAHPVAAGPVLDLANFLTREGLCKSHPATGHAQQLAKLLDGLVARLERIAEQSPADRQAEQESRDAVAQCVPLVVGLCDALAQIGGPSCAASLHAAAQLPHRRIQTEAAWALAKIGDAAGQQVLLQLAAEPVARLRAIRYAEELGIDQQVDPQHRTAQALAEAELCAWLSEPAQFGLPPAELTLFDARQWYWPGYDDPVECFLFQFSYRLPQGRLTNIGIAGPLTHAFAGDIRSLTPEDIYAAFAGWHALHEEIEDVPVEHLTDAGRNEVVRLQRRLTDAGYEHVRPQLLSLLLGEKTLIALAEFRGQKCWAVAESDDEWRLPIDDASGLNAGEVACLARGRRMLQTFNEL